MNALTADTLLRRAWTQAEAAVSIEKTRALDDLAREALRGQANLADQVALYARNDPLRAYELSYFTEIARLGKGEVVADQVTSFCEESRS